MLRKFILAGAAATVAISVNATALADANDYVFEPVKATAQAIIRQLDKLRIGRKPPLTVRTIQADILFMRRNGIFGM